MTIHPEGISPTGDEQALIPTDDEREALLTEADALVASWDQKGSWSSDSPVGMVMRLAAALRRTEAPEPRRRMPKRLVNQLRRASGALEEYEFEGVAGDAPGLMNSAADLIEREWGSRPEPQGEPSDAQAAEEADRRWPHTPGDPDTASARSARRLSFRQGVEWARAAGVVGQDGERDANA